MTAGAATSGVTGSRRLSADVDGMSRHYPGFWLTRPVHGMPRWTGWLKPFRSRLATFRVVLTYRVNQQGVPTVWVVSPEVSKRTFPFHPHLNSDGSACTFFVPDRTYDPLVDDVSILVDLTLDWLRRHVFWDERGWWPGPEAPHDPVGMLQEVRGTEARCVCGSGMSLRECHGLELTNLARAQRRGELTCPAPPRGMRGSITLLKQELRGTLGARQLAALLPHQGPPAGLLDSGAA